MKHWLIAAALCLAGIATPALAQSGDVSKQIINAPTPDSFITYGLSAKPAVRKDGTVQGGHALRVPIDGASDKPYSIGLISEVKQPIKQGDKLVIAVWVRAEKLPEGAASAKIATIQLGLAKEPYTTVFGGSAEATGEWKMVHVSGVADKDYAAGDVSVSLHLATGKQVLDIGPIFLLDLNK